MYRSITEPLDGPKWQHHSMRNEISCNCCSAVMPPMKTGKRHHCRACGNIVCTNCCDTACLTSRITEKNGMEYLHKEDSGGYSVISVVCKNCKIACLIKDNSKTKGIPMPEFIEKLGPSTIHQTYTNDVNTTTQNGKEATKTQSQSPGTSSTNNTNNTNNQIPTHHHRARAHHATHQHHQIKCTSCGLGVPVSLQQTFDWTDLLQHAKKGNSKVVEEPPLFCHRCYFSINDFRGGLKASSCFVTRLSPNVIPEDLHATLDDHFGGVQRVHIPRGEDGKPKTDGDGFSFAQVFFYKKGTSTESSTSTSTSLTSSDSENMSTRWSDEGGLQKTLKTGWCWNGMSKGERCRIHNHGGMTANNNLDNNLDSSLAIGAMAIRSKMSLSEHVRHVQGDHGAFNTHAASARERLLNRSVAIQTQEIRNQATQIFKFNDMQSPFNLAKHACQHNDVTSMSRLLDLNSQAVSHDAKLRRQLFDPYQMYQGRTLLHTAACYGSYDVLSLLLSDASQAAAMTIRAQQQRVLASSNGVTHDEGDIFERAVNQIDSSGFSSLNLVCLSNTSSTVKAIQLLLDRGGDPNSSTSRGETSLYFAAKNQNTNAVLELVGVTEISAVVKCLKSLDGDVSVDIKRLLKERIKRN